jgi:integrase
VLRRTPPSTKFPGGTNVWALRYRRQPDLKKQTLKLGYYPEVELAEARERATRARARVELDGDPQGERMEARKAARRAAGHTLADLGERWLKHGRVTKGGARKGEPWREKTRAEFERLVRNVIAKAPIGSKHPGTVTRADIRDFFDSVPKASVAKHALAVLRLIYEWAADEDYVAAKPAFPKRGTETARRDRVLSDADLRSVWATLGAGISDGEEGEPGIIEGAFRLLLLTGQRRGEVLRMRWADLSNEPDGSWWTIPAHVHKSGREHRVPLSDAAVAELRRLHALTGPTGWIFPTPHHKTATAARTRGHISNPQKAAERMWKRSGVTGARVHDFRRTAATRMASLKVPRLVIGKVLGHTDSGVTGTYDKFEYGDEKRQALAAWAAALLEVVTANAQERREPAPWES